MKYLYHMALIIKSSNFQIIKLKMITVTIGNKLRPFKFGFNAIDIFCREHKITISEFGERFSQIGKGTATIGELRDIIYAGLAGGALSTGEKIEFTNFQVGDWMDELPQGELAKMMEAIISSVNVPGKKKASEMPQPSKMVQVKTGEQTQEKVKGRKP